MENKPAMIIWLASYPRSGNTFLRVILHQMFGLKTYSIYGDVDDISADENTKKIVGHQPLPRNFSVSKARMAKKCYIIKTHELQPQRQDKAIYLVRDGRESMLSFKNYIDDYGAEKKDLTDIIFGNVVFGGWGEHLRSWDPSERQNTLFIKFEHLVDNPAGNVEKIADFIGRAPKGNSVSDFAELKKINPVFFRSGKKNSWKSTFSTDEHLLFWLQHGKEMKKYGYFSEMPSILNDELSDTMLTAICSAHSLMVNVAQKKHARLIMEREDWRELLAQKDKEIAKLQARANSTRDLLKEKSTRIRKIDKLLTELRMQLDELDLHTQTERKPPKRLL